MHLRRCTSRALISFKHSLPAVFINHEFIALGIEVVNHGRYVCIKINEQIWQSGI